MSSASPTPVRFASLQDIRAEIDRIDAAIHALLIERSAVVGDLIAVKAVQPPSSDDPRRATSAFRPAREAAMMREIIERHTGLLPLDTVESIWRVIISTFTYVQAPYEVIYAYQEWPLAMRDVARFHFGYTVPVRPVRNADDVLDAVGTRGDALGVVPLSPEGGWWRRLEGQGAANVIARLPFVERPDHPAGMPCLLVANAPIDPAVMACTVVAATLEESAELPEGCERLAGDREALLSLGPNQAIEDLLRAPGVITAKAVGSHAPMFKTTDIGAAL